jgi:16S rRNA G966 N2-methylase RsmD
MMVRSRFMEVLNGKLEKGLLEQLKNVFFEVVYLTPPYNVKA